ncbi:hypothetical protein [Qipengyuania seohaensis]|uniref:hypothetical protein n=1 Tax=Qipengyuania seohaensis TaxID=266951 RepID=UPI0018E23400|nr:hypothetical protein [Qipengyuania seohaensis]
MAFGIVSAAWAVDFSLDPAIDEFIKFDITTGASVAQHASDARTITFTIPDETAARAEIRRASQASGPQDMGGTFTLTNQDGDFLSIIQALNVKARNKPTGSSEPVAQLAIRKTGKLVNVDGGLRASYEFYIEQQNGKPTCAALGTFTHGEPVSIAMTYDMDEWPVFTRDGDPTKTCTGGKPDRLMGDPSGEARGTFYYYGKLGVYQTNSGAGSSQVVWTEIFD